MTQNGIKKLVEALPNDVFLSSEWIWEITKKIWAEEEKKRLEERRLKIEKIISKNESIGNGGIK